LQSDSHGQPVLTANHIAAIGQGTIIVKQSGALGSGASSGGILRQLIARRQQQSSSVPGTGQEPNVTTSAGGVDVYDYNGYWKLFDGLTDAAFYGKNRQYALGNTPEQTSLGNWSDGVAIKPLLVVAKP
jgi:hypothetical protein